MYIYIYIYVYCFVCFFWKTQVFPALLGAAPRSVHGRPARVALWGNDLLSKA